MVRERDVRFMEQFRESMLDRTKGATARTHKLGSVGDYFRKWDARFEIIAVVKMPLGFISDHLFDVHGMDSPEAFRADWAKFYPLKGYDPEQIVFEHFIRRTDD